MKRLSLVTLVAGVLLVPPAISAQTRGTAGGCSGCAQSAPAAAPAAAVVARPIPGTNETMPVGKIENLVPIGMLTVLGCERCAAEAVGWALLQGSSIADVERVLETVAAMQKLDCFNQQFGPETAARMEKPLAAARRALEEASTRAGK